LSAVEPDAARLIAEGNDSDVYRVDDDVVKEYRELTRRQVERYVELCARAREVLAGSPYVAELPLEGKRWTASVRELVPIDRLDTAPAGHPITVSRYVGAPNLARLMLPPQAFAEYAEAELVDPDLRAFGERINAALWHGSAAATILKEELEYHVAQLSSVLCAELGVSGLYVGLPNVKLQAGAGERRIDLILTDVALFVDRVEPA